MLIVQKFGGSSLADLEKLRRAASLGAEARRREQQLVIVVSAAGDTTDELLRLAKQITSRPPRRELDALLATGEQQSSALMAIMLESLGVPARSFSGAQAGIGTDGRHGEARIRLLAPDRILATLEEGQVAVVAGFQGADARGDVTTLGRGGSDTTAVALAAALEAGRCEIYTDVDGIYTADPRLVPDAHLLSEIDFRDMLALARGGSQVLHPDSVQLAMENRVPLWLMSSFSPVPGTAVCALPEERRPAVAGVTRSQETGTVTAVGKALGGQSLSLLLPRLEAAGIGVSVASAEPGCVSIKVAPSQLLATLELVHQILFS